MDRTRLAVRLAAAAACFAGAACGDGGGGGGGGPAPDAYWVYADALAPEVSTAWIDVYGSASCDACPETEWAFGGCPAIQGPFDSAIAIHWTNVTTAAAGDAVHRIYGSCGCLFSYCSVVYEHRFWTRIPLALGVNEIELLALGPQGSGREVLTITRLASGALLSSPSAAGPSAAPSGCL